MEENNLYVKFDKNLYKIVEKTIVPIGSDINPDQIISGAAIGDVTQTAGEMKSANFLTSSAGWRLTPTSGEFNFPVSVDSLDIPDAVTADSFHVDNEGNAWWGATTLASSLARILKSGIATFTSANVVSSTYTERFEAGENITDGNIVCIKPEVGIYYPSDDTYIFQNIPDSNYGTATSMYVGLGSGSKIYRSFIKWNLTTIPAAQYILKAELKIYVSTLIGTPSDLSIQRVSSADWSEGTGATDGSELCWNTPAPSSTADISSVYGSQVTPSVTPTLGNWVTFDITHFLRHWKDANVNNYGFEIVCSTPGTENNYYGISTVEATSNKPYIILYKAQESDGKVYKADSSDYLLSRGIVGVAQETFNSGATGEVQTHGKVTNSVGTGGGNRVYLASAGGVTESASNAYRVISLGKSTAVGSFIINIQDNDICIEKLVNNLVITSATRIYAPSDARYVVVISDDGTHGKKIHKIPRGTVEPNDVTTEVESYSSFSTLRIAWSATYITLTPSASTVVQIYYYT